MASPTQLNITVTTNNAGAYTTTVVTVAIPSALQSLDSTTPGSVQTGYSAADQAIRNIFRAGVFTDGAGNWYPTSVIQKITAQ